MTANTFKRTERDAASFADGHIQTKGMDGEETNHASVEGHHGFGSRNRNRGAC